MNRESPAMERLLLSWNQRNDSKRFKGDSGIALMLVLWVLALLSIMVFEFCYTMRIEATITKNFKEGERSYYLAQAGINRALIELIKTQSSVKKFTGSKDTLVRGEEEDDEEEEGTKEWKPREEPYTFSFDEGECTVVIRDEGSKINLNWMAQKAKSDRKLLADIVEKSCGLEGEDRDIIVDSIIDWVDKDHNHMMNGAEDEYYESLEDPYESRDGDFVVAEELLLVRGVTEDIFYGRSDPFNDGDTETEKRDSFARDTFEAEDGEGGSGIYQGLSELFTVFSASDALKVNINDAPYGLLMAVPAMTEDIAQRIIELRREEEFENIRDARLMELPNYNQVVPSLTVDPTNYYRIEARGGVTDIAAGRSISVVVELTPRQKDKYTILYWQEGV
jgi:general secretion pathway protein K